MIRLKRVFHLLREHSSHAGLRSRGIASYFEMQCHSCMNLGELDCGARAPCTDVNATGRDVDVGLRPLLAARSDHLGAKFQTFKPISRGASSGRCGCRIACKDVCVPTFWWSGLATHSGCRLVP